jgi:hypothetical protein
VPRDVVQPFWHGIPQGLMYTERPPKFEELLGVSPIVWYLDSALPVRTGRLWWTAQLLAPLKQRSGSGCGEFLANSGRVLQVLVAFDPVKLPPPVVPMRPLELLILLGCSHYLTAPTTSLNRTLIPSTLCCVIKTTAPDPKNTKEDGEENDTEETPKLPVRGNEAGALLSLPLSHARTEPQVSPSASNNCTKACNSNF